MPAEATNTNARRQLRQVFQFLEQWHLHQIEVPRDWRGHAWTLPLGDVPNHPFVEVGQLVGEQDESEFVLRVRRPTETPCPDPPDELRAWLQHGWREPDRDVDILQSRNELIDGDAVTIRFDADPLRTDVLSTWNAERNEWREAEVPVRKVVALYQRMFELRGRLERESERLQFVLGEGMLRLHDTNGVVEHPLLLQRVELRFVDKVPRFDVVLGDDPPELNSALLRNLPTAEGKQIGAFRERIRAGEAHLLDRSAVKALLTEMTHALFARGRFLDEPRPIDEDAQVTAASVLMLMPRNARYTEAIQTMAARLTAADQLPAPLVGLVGLDDTPTHSSEAADDAGPRRVSAGAIGQAPTRGQVRRELLLTKPANAQQEEILRRLEVVPTVVVQGPPGTGKTHTIGNLLGHLLAQGKRVLVTSHTPKALRVLREQLAEPLQPLCVSVLDDDAKSRQQLKTSVETISSRLSSPDSARLKVEADRLGRDRDRLIEQLDEAEAALEQAIGDEYLEFVANGRTFAPAQAAKFIRELGASHAWIPPDIDPSGPLPLPAADLRELYRLNEEVLADEEEDLDGELPDLSAIPTPDRLRVVTTRVVALQEKELRVPDDAWTTDPPIDRSKLSSARIALTDAIRDVVAIRERPHLLECVEAGRRGGPARDLWNDFIAFVSEHRSNIERDDALARRRTVAVRVDVIDDALLQTIRQLRAAVTHQKTVFRLMAKVGKGLHPGWKRILDSSEVDGRRPRDDSDFEAVEAFVRVRVNRSRLLQRWRGHFEPHREIAAAPLGETPEVACSQHLDQIIHALHWHERLWNPALDLLKKVGVSLDSALRRCTPRTTRFAELTRVIDAANAHVREWLQRRTEQLELDEMTSQLDGWRERLTALGPDRDVSGLAKCLALAVAELDPMAYETAYERLATLERKRLRLGRRRQLLRTLGDAAPGWAALIASRQSPHDQPFLPGDPQMAWTYRQLCQELDRRARVDIADAQRRASQLRQALQTKTVELVDRLAWGQLYERTSKKEQKALQQWVATVTAKGFESGIRSVQLKSQARRLLEQCRSCVPVWIMTIARAIDSLDLATAQFDVVIVDESSQCDMLGMIILGLSNKAIVVGDDMQVSPSAVGELLSYTQKLIDEYLRELDNRELFTGRLSLYHIATQSFGNPLCLTEHFRCAEDIISFSNHLSYDGRIRPLRDTSAVQTLPHVIAHRVAGGHRDGDVNEAEVSETASLVAAAIEQPEYAGATFGVITMLKDRQALEIDAVLRRRLPEAVYARARVLCGSPPQFQGDERDIVFLSLVDSGPSDGGPLSLRGSRDDDLKKRYNVAASRARDQLWVVHSLDADRDLKGDDLRARLIKHAQNPGAVAKQRREIDREADSDFERQVGTSLTDAGYRVRPQWRVGSLAIDLVIVGADDRKVALECDGDRFHPMEKLKDDLDRQMLLERLGWRFIRLRGSVYYRDPDEALARVRQNLTTLGIQPIGPDATPPKESQGHDLFDRVCRRAAELRRAWASDQVDAVDDTDEAATTEPVEVGLSAVSATPLGHHPALDGATSSQPTGANASRVLACLRESGTALARREILDRTAIVADEWQRTISALVDSGSVRRIGTKRGAKYVAPAPESLYPNAESPDPSMS